MIDLGLCVCLFRAILAAYGGFQARGRIGAVAAGLCHRHSNTRSELRLRPTPQLIQILNLLSEARIKPASLWMLVRFVSAEPRRELPDLSLFEYLSNPPTSFSFSFHDLNLGPYCSLGKFQQALFSPCIQVPSICKEQD